MAVLDPFEEALRRAEEMGVLPIPPMAEPEHDPEVIPDVGTYERRPEDIEIDKVLDSIDILQAYVRWCGKMSPSVGSKRESIMVSCPNPAHKDEHPSAWLNLDKGTWYCGACSEGGDKFDIAAWKFGFDVPGYKAKDQFPKLRHAMASDLGVTFLKVPGGSVRADPESDDPETELAPVVPLRMSDVIGTEETTNIDVVLPWREIFPEGTFVYQYVTTCSADSCTTEYHIFNALLAVSLAAGRNVRLPDNPDVLGNLFLCHYGDTGSGKSKAASTLNRLLTAALPYDHTDITSTGVRHIGSPSSAESLLDQFHKPEYDPVDPKKVVTLHPVKGFVTFNELSELTTKASRSGNPIKATLMSLYDGYGEVSTISRAGGTVTAKDSYCCTLSSTQPGAIKNLLTTDDAVSGFLNRWIFPAGKRKSRTMFDAKSIDISRMIEPLRRMRAWCSPGIRLTMTPEAHIVLGDWFLNDFERIVMGDDFPLMSRCDLTIKKLLLLMAVNENTTEINEDMARRVLNFWPYLVTIYLYLSQRIGSTVSRECGDAITQSFVRLGAHRAISLPELIKFTRLDRRFDRKLIDETLGFMIKLGEVEPVTSTRKGAGRPTLKYRLINPPTTDEPEEEDSGLSEGESPATV